MNLNGWSLVAVVIALALAGTIFVSFLTYLIWLSSAKVKYLVAKIWLRVHPRSEWAKQFLYDYKGSEGE